MKGKTHKLCIARAWSGLEQCRRGPILRDKLPLLSQVYGKVCSEFPPALKNGIPHLLEIPAAGPNYPDTRPRDMHFATPCRPSLRTRCAADQERACHLTVLRVASRERAPGPGGAHAMSVRLRVPRRMSFTVVPGSCRGRKSIGENRLV